MFNSMSNNSMYGNNDNNANNNPSNSQPSTTGTLKTTISLGGKNPTISGPFYLMKDFSPGLSDF